jgi:hypothetical protein
MAVALRMTVACSWMGENQMTSKAGRQAGQFWFLSIVQHLKLALEIYAGREIDIHTIVTQQRATSMDDDKMLQTRVFDIKAESALWDASCLSGISVEGLTLTNRYGHLMWHWASGMKQLSVGVAVFNEMKLCMPSSQFDLGATYPEARWTPFIEIKKSGSGDCWRTGHHLGERVVQKPGYVPQAVFPFIV